MFQSVVICIRENNVIAIDITNMAAVNYIFQFIADGISYINQDRKVYKHPSNQ